MEIQPVWVYCGFPALSSATSLLSCDTTVTSWLTSWSVRSHLLTSFSRWVTSYVGCDDVRWTRVTAHRLSRSSTTAISTLFSYKLISTFNQSVKYLTEAVRNISTPPNTSLTPSQFWNYNRIIKASQKGVHNRQHSQNRLLICQERPTGGITM